jgi:hypothetical protein
MLGSDFDPSGGSDDRSGPWAPTGPGSFCLHSCGDPRKAARASSSAASQASVAAFLDGRCADGVDLGLGRLEVVNRVQLGDGGGQGVDVLGGELLRGEVQLGGAGEPDGDGLAVDFLSALPGGLGGARDGRFMPGSVF